MSGPSGGGSTTVQSNAPPPQFLQAYQETYDRAKQVAQQPYQVYGGNTVAPFSPDQYAAFSGIENAQGIAAPYINTAADYLNDATRPLLPTAQPYLDQAQGIYSGAGAPLTGAAQPYINQARGIYSGAGSPLTAGSAAMGQATGIYGGAGAPLDLTSFSPGAVRQYESPYTEDVVNATSRLFNEQNAQQANQLRGNAIAAGAFGGDREGVAQGVLAGQQQLSQAPVLAGLRNTGYQQALQEFNAQQAARLQASQAARQLGLSGAQGLAGIGATQLGAEQAARQLGLTGASGIAGLGTTELGAAQAARQLGLSGAQGIAGLGQTALGAEQANRWLSSQAGYGYAGLGNQALSSSLTGLNALLGVGGLQQQQAQAQLNVPYQQWQGALAYPFQTTGWLSNIAQGLGSASGGTSSTTVPGPSVGSQIAGAGLAGLGILGQTGAFGGGGGGGGGWLSGLFGGGGGGGVVDSGLFDTFAARGGAIPHRAPGGGIAPLPYGSTIPDESISIVPMGPSSGGTPYLKRNWGTTSTSSGGGGNQAGQVIGDIAKVVGTVAMFLRDGGGIANDNQGNDNNPNRATGTHGIAALADGGSPAGVIFVPGRYPGSHAIPHLLTAPASGGIAPTGGNVQDYLSNVMQGASFARPQAPIPAPPPPPAPAPVFSDMGALSHLLSTFGGLESGGGGGTGGLEGQGGMDTAEAAAGGMDVGSSHDTGQTELAAEAAGSAAGDLGGGGGQDMSSEPGGGGLWARGGIIPHRQGGGGLDLDFSSADSDWRDDAPALGGGAGPMPAIGGGIDMESGPYGTTAEPIMVRPRQTAESTPPAVDTTALPPYEGAPSGIANEPQNTSAAPQSGGISPLTYAGLGILGGSSPFASVNIGRGALTGLQAYNQDRLARERIAENALYRRALLGERAQRDTALQGYRNRRADQFDAAADLRARIADRAATLRSQGLDDRRANAQARLDVMRANADTSRTRAEGNLAYQGARLGQGDTTNDLKARALDLRAQQLAQSKDAAEQRARLIAAGHDARSADSIIGNAAKLVAAGSAKMKDFPQLVDRLRTERQRVQPAAPAAAAPASAAPARGAADPLAAARDAIARGAPRDAVIQRLRDNGIDPSGL